MSAKRELFGRDKENACARARFRPCSNLNVSISAHELASGYTLFDRVNISQLHGRVILQIEQDTCCVSLQVMFTVALPDTSEICEWGNLCMYSRGS